MLAKLGNQHCVTGDQAAAEEAFRRARELLDANDDPPVRGVFCRHNAFFLWRAGKVSEARREALGGVQRRQVPGPAAEQREQLGEGLVGAIELGREQRRDLELDRRLAPAIVGVEQLLAQQLDEARPVRRVAQHPAERFERGLLVEAYFHDLSAAQHLRPAMRLLHRVYLDRGDVRSAVMYLDQEIRATRHPREAAALYRCLLYTSPSPRDRTRSRMPSSA